MLRARAVSIILSLLISFSLIIGAYFFADPSFLKTPTADAESIRKALEAYSVKDTDADGLPDWQEALYNTDPKNPESFKEGTLDGEAVRAGLIKPAFESAPPVVNPINPEDISEVNPAPNTLTDRFAKILFEGFISERQGEALSPGEIATFVTGAALQLEDMYERAPRFTKADLTIVPQTGEEALRAYAKEMEKVLAENIITTPHDELTHYYSAINQESDEDMQQVVNIAKYYGALAEGAKSVEVPRDLADAHLALINSFSKLAVVLSDMTKVNEDPLLAFLAMGMHERSALDMADALRTLSGSFSTSGIVIAPDEEGYGFSLLLKQVSTLREEAL